MNIPALLRSCSDLGLSRTLTTHSLIALQKAFPQERRLLDFAKANEKESLQKILDTNRLIPALVGESFYPGLPLGSTTALLLDRFFRLKKYLLPGRYNQQFKLPNGQWRNEYCYTHPSPLSPDLIRRLCGEKLYAQLQSNFDPDQWRYWGASPTTLVAFSDKTLEGRLTAEELATIPRESFACYRQEVEKRFGF